MKVKSLKQLKVRGRVVFLRSDLNSDIVDGKVLLGERIKESIRTIRYLKRNGARVVVLAHQGNPGKSNFLGLEQHAKLLSEFVKVKFVRDVVGSRAVGEIEMMKNGDVILLDNVRKVKDEFLPKKKMNIFLKSLLPLCEVYINDAFSVSHRNHFSIVGFAEVEEKGIGLLFEKEIKALEKIKLAHNSVPSKSRTKVSSSSGKDCLFILGGAKAESNIKLLGSGNRILACGLFGQVCLDAKGKYFGYQNDFLEKNVLVDREYRVFLKKLKKKLDGVEMPVDFAVEEKGKRKEFLLREFPMNLRIDDIGNGTIKKYCEIIRKAKCIYMKGPAGFAEDEKFSKGSVEILKAVARCKGFSLVGGGQLSSAIEKYGINKKGFGHVSLSGGATLRVIAGERLVGLEVLGYY